MNLFKESIKHINVLFVGGGRRVSLASRFLDKGCNLFSYETDINCPISTVSTVIPGLRWKDLDITNHLNNICDQNKIDIIIPLQDEAIPICCDLNAACPASLQASTICFDKLEFASSMKSYDEYPAPTQNYKVIVKPRYGFNSKGLYITNYHEALQSLNFSLFVWQKYIEGTEYSVDCYFNKNSDLVGFVPRKRDVVQGGEVVQSTTITRNSLLYDKLEIFISTAFKKIGAVGPYCIQFIEKDDHIYIIEANARFGGGVILSLESGFDIIDLILKEYFYGVEINKQVPSWKENFSMTRYFSEYFYDC